MARVAVLRWAGVLLAAAVLAACTAPAPQRFADPRVTELVDAAAAGDGTRVRELVASGVDLEARDEHGSTPFLALVEASELTGVRTVLDAGADRTAALDAGATAVHLAAGRARPDVLRLLLELGFDPSTPDTQTGAGPLRSAFLGRHDDAARLLIAAGTDVDLADRNGRRPLHDAAATNHTAAVRWLLEAGADPTARTPDGATFQTYLFGIPEDVLNEASLADRDWIEEWLRARGIPSERR